MSAFPVVWLRMAETTASFSPKIRSATMEPVSAWRVRGYFLENSPNILPYSAQTVNCSGPSSALVISWRMPARAASVTSAPQRLASATAVSRQPKTCATRLGFSSRMTTCSNSAMGRFFHWAFTSYSPCSRMYAATPGDRNGPAQWNASIRRSWVEEISTMSFSTRQIFAPRCSSFALLSATAVFSPLLPR